jgi:hypothetical protein
MKHNKTLILLAAVTLTSMLVIGGQKTKIFEQPDVSQFPILDYQKKSTAVESDNKERKKYNNRHAPRIGESSDSIFSISDWEVNLPALPVAKSEAVVLGEVTDAQARLSEDETNIYSEFTVELTNILKNDNNFTLGIGKSVVVERLGGRVRLPSGKIIVSQTDKQDLPRIGKRYVLFLTRDEGDEDFHILTGYELREGKVFPLDKLRPGHPITSYTGTSEASFFTDLNQILADSSASRSR